MKAFLLTALIAFSPALAFANSGAAYVIKCTTIEGAQFNIYQIPQSHVAASHNPEAEVILKDGARYHNIPLVLVQEASGVALARFSDQGETLNVDLDPSLLKVGGTGSFSLSGNVVQDGGANATAVELDGTCTAVSQIELE